MCVIIASVLFPDNTIFYNLQLNLSLMHMSRLLRESDEWDKKS